MCLNLTNFLKEVSAQCCTLRFCAPAGGLTVCAGPTLFKPGRCRKMQVVPIAASPSLSFSESPLVFRRIDTFYFCPNEHCHTQLRLFYKFQGLPSIRADGCLYVCSHRRLKAQQSLQRRGFNPGTSRGATHSDEVSRKLRSSGSVRHREQRGPQLRHTV